MQWSLEKIYKEQVKGNIPPRKHLKVIGEAKITFDYEGGKSDTLDGIDDKTAFRVADYLQDKAEGSFMLKEDYLVIQELAKKSGFESEDRFLKILFQQFENVNYKGLKELVDKKEGLNVLSPLLKEEVGSFQIYSLCKPQLEMFLHEEDQLKFYNMLFARDFKESNVSVGNGELALAVLTEATKGTVGDLEVGNTSVELKTGKGRVISARGKGFNVDRQKIIEIATYGGLETGDGNYTLDGVNEGTWNSAFCKQGLTKPALEKIINSYPVNEEGDNNSNKLNIDARKQRIGALLLFAYGNGAPDEDNEDEGGHKFDIWLGVYQHGFKASKRGDDRFAEGTWSAANYVNVKSLETINTAVEKGLIRFEYDGDGVYGFFPGSSSTAAGKAMRSYKLFN